jgi:hypothetical protein
LSHITVIINRAPPPPSATSAAVADTPDPVTAYVSYAVPHEASDADVGQMAKKLYRQVKDLGS